MMVCMLGLCFWILQKHLTVLIMRFYFRSLGVVGTSYQWFASYLSGRSQWACYHSVLSDSGDITVGVPQGSILGPLLFSLYVNDLPYAVVSSDVYQYADDTLMFYCN